MDMEKVCLWREYKAQEQDMLYADILCAAGVMLLGDSENLNSRCPLNLMDPVVGWD